MGNAFYRFYTETNQQWDSYPESPNLLEDYPYQYIASNGVTTYLQTGTVPARIVDGYDLGAFSEKMPTYLYTGGAWVAVPDSYSTYSAADYNWLVSMIKESNHDIYYGEVLSFAKSIEPSNSVMLTERIRNLNRKNTTFIKSRKMQYKDTTWKRVNL